MLVDNIARRVLQYDDAALCTALISRFIVSMAQSLLVPTSAYDMLCEL